MDAVKKVFNFVIPAAKKEDGRDVWPSRLSFVLAAMGGAVGLGNLLRYPSVVFVNNGLQWFIPYFIALGFLAIPLLILEISLGQAARGGGAIAFNALDKRARGIGIGTIFTGYIVACYYVPILSWVMNYFRNSFKSPLPWEGNGDAFFNDEVVANVDPVAGTFADDGSVLTYTSYPGRAFIGETVGWAAFAWFVVWLCMFRGVGASGRAVYVLMGLPIAMLFVLLGRGVSLDNAIDGIRMYMGHWDSAKLATPRIWQDAAGQIFFSTGVGFGYFTAFASYNTQMANAVQDAVIIGCSNSLYEILAGFAVFGVIGYLGLRPEDGVELGTFTVGFLTYPEAVAKMPAAQFWGVIFFLTIMLVGLSSAYALVESVVTLIVDTDWGKKFPRPVICTIVIVISFLLSLMYCTEFGFHLLGAVDTWANNFCLLFMAWSECIAVSTVYRYRDVVDQVGVLSFGLYNFGYLSGTVVGLGVAHSVGPEAGAGVGFGLFVAGTVLAVIFARNPDAPAPGFWGKNKLLSGFWWVAFYSVSRPFTV